MARSDPPTVRRQPARAGALVGDFRGWAGRRAGTLVATAVAAALLEGAGLLLLLPVLHLSFGGGDARLRWLPDDPVARLALLAGAFLAVIALRSRVSTARDVGLARLQHGYVEALRARLLARLAGAPWPIAARIGQAELVRVLEIELPRVGLAVNFALNAVVAALLLAVAGGVALAVAPAAALTGLLLCGVAGALGSLHLRRAHAGGAALTASSLAPADRALRLLDGLKVAAAQGERPAFRSEVERAGADAAAARIDAIAVQVAARNQVTALFALAALTLLALGATVFHLPPATLGVLMVVLSRMAAPATLMQQTVVQLVQAAPAFAEVRAFEEALPPPAADAVAREPIAAPTPLVALREVGFRHPGSAGGVERVSLTIAPGTLLGVAGASGSGKTTFVDLIAGLIVPDRGEILVDGRAADRDGFPARLAYVGGDPVLFGDTVRRNLLWSASGQSDAALWQALRVAGAEPLVRALPSGLNAVLAARGQRLSAGERQRLAIARAVLRRPGLMILDEATASLDVASEAAILAALRALEPAPTIILVSHRAETLAACDRVVTLAGGRLVSDDPAIIRSQQGALA